MSLSEAAGIEQAMEAAARLMPRDGRVIAKRGPLGASGLSGGRLVHMPAPKVTAVDTIGAGDVFNAGYLAAIARGELVRGLRSRPASRSLRGRSRPIRREFGPPRGSAQAEPGREGSACRLLTIRGVTKRYGSIDVLKGIDIELKERRVPGAAGVVGLRQVDPAQHHRRAGRRDRRRAADRRSRHHRCPSQGPRHRHGVPVLRALSEHDASRAT